MPAPGSASRDTRILGWIGIGRPSWVSHARAGVMIAAHAAMVLQRRRFSR
jgi:hypothetical protein